MLLPADEERLIVTIDQNPQVQSALLRYASFSWLFFLSRHLYLNAVWLGVDLRVCTMKTHV